MNLKDGLDCDGWLDFGLLWVVNGLMLVAVGFVIAALLKKGKRKKFLFYTFLSIIMGIIITLIHGYMFSLCDIPCGITGCLDYSL